MIISEKKLENARVELQIEVPDTEVENEYIKVFNTLQKNVKVDGFRKGKVPLDIVIKKFKGNADTEVAENIVKTYYIEALKEKDLSPISQPEIEFDKIERAQPFKFNVRFDVAPIVELGNYKNLSAKENACKITDNDVEKEIESTRERFGTVSKKEEGEKAEKGDYVRAESKRIDNIDEAEIDNIKATPVSVIVDKYKTEYSFDEDIIGMKVGETKEITRKYPKDYEDSNLAGQKAKYLVKILEISSLTLPALDDEFAKDLGTYESMEDVRKKIREDFERFVNDKVVKDVKGDLIKTIIETSKFDLPESMIQREMSNILEKFKTNMGLQDKGIEELFQKGMLERDKFLSQVREDAIKNIKSTLVLFEVAKAENIKPDQEKYKEIVKNYAERSNKSIEEVEKDFEESGTNENIETDLVINAASDFIYDNANIKKQKAVSFEELMKPAK